MGTVTKHITLYTKPVPLNALYRCVRSRNIISKRGREAKSALATEIALKWKYELLKGSVSVSIILYFGDKRKRDIDAYLKILLDGMEGIVYENDVQINELHVYKEYDKKNPRVDIYVV